MLYFNLPINHELSLVKPQLYMAEELFLLTKKNNDHLKQYLDFVLTTNEVADSANFIKNSLQKELDEQELLLFICHQSTMIGCIDLHNINTTHQKAEIGYWLDKDFNKKGIMSNCVNKMVQLAFNSLNLNKLIILVEKDNIPSNNVAKKAGFSFDGLEREELKRVKGFVDVNKYSLLKSDYQKTL